MNKVEKVISGLKHCLRDNDCSHCEGCPYNDCNDFECKKRLREDLIKILKVGVEE